VRFVRRTCLY